MARLSQARSREVAKRLYRALRAAGVDGACGVELAEWCELSLEDVLTGLVWMRGQGVEVVCGRPRSGEGLARFALRELLPEPWDGLV